MYKVTWDKKTGGVLLQSKITEDTLGISPRPVFFEELDLLGLNDKGWTYPHCEEPIMWAINKQYWYRGVKLFDVKGADIYHSPTIQFVDGIKPIVLNPVDVKAMISKTSDFMFVLENEAIEFIRDTYMTYSNVNEVYNSIDANKIDYENIVKRMEKKNKQKMVVVKQDCDSFDIMPLKTANQEGKRVLFSTKIDRFIVSFSGGKDSQVVLDLCTRAIPPTDFEVIYSDTGYELPPSLALYKDVEKFYKEKFPSLNFLMSCNHESVLYYWDKIGTPSDIHRWCCSIMKTVPLYRELMKETDKKQKFLAFEGVRAEESVKRSDYNRIGKGVKHHFVVNARPILRWNTTEVFLYLFRNHLKINLAYRFGKTRVGCILCPFGSPWDDMIVNKCYPENLKPFLSKIEAIADARKIPNKTEYIAERKWKLRTSRFLESKTSVSITSTAIKWQAIVKGAEKSIFSWLPILGGYSIKESNSSAVGEIMFRKEVFSFEIKYGKTKSDFTFTLHDNNNIRLRFYLRRIINKTAYCINCEACELECPTGALSVYPNINVDIQKCVHCYKCLDYHNVGCIVVDSLAKTEETNKSNMKISKYGTFGIHNEWVDQYLRDTELFWTESILGVKQVPSFKAWLKDAEIIDEKANLTEFGKICIKLNEDNPIILWELIHINLCYNNPLMKWFVSAISSNRDIVRKDLDRLAIEYFSGYSLKETTITYAVQALVQTFKYSPIGDELLQCVIQDTKGTIFKRLPYNDLSPEAVAYSIYKFAESKGMKMLRVSDFYKQDEQNGVYKEFCILKTELQKKLRYLSSDTNRVLVAELNMGLDHITLLNDMDSLSVLKRLLA